MAGDTALELPAPAVKRSHVLRTAELLAKRLFLYFPQTLRMLLLAAVSDFGDRVNDACFLAALVVVTIFYKQYRREFVLMQHEELLDGFLKD
jgi:hypothetical protein